MFDESIEIDIELWPPKIHIKINDMMTFGFASFIFSCGILITCVSIALALQIR